MLIGLVLAALALVAGGIYAVWTGFEIIIVERGWTLVIAGSTALTGGFVLLGLCLVVREVRSLRSVQATLAAQATLLKSASSADDDEPLPGVNPAALRAEPRLDGMGTSLHVPAAGATAAIAAAVLPAQRNDDLADVDQPSLDLRRQEDDLFGVSAPAEPAADETSPSVTTSTIVIPTWPDLEREPGAERADTLAPAGSDVDGMGPEQSALAPAVDPPSPEPPPVATAWASADSWTTGIGDTVSVPVITFRDGEPAAQMDTEIDSQVHFQADFQADAEPEAPSDAGVGARAEIRAQADAAVVATTDAVAEPAEPLAQSDAPLAEDDAAGAGDAPSVIGSYASGDHTYVMYSDGSIEAQMPEGTYRFGSLDELKAFIAEGGPAQQPA